MDFPMYIDPDDIASLEFDPVPNSLKWHLSRLLDRKISEIEPEFKIIRQNEIINKSRNIAGLPVYVLEADEDGYFQPFQEAWHNGEFHLVFIRLNTAQFAELICDLIEAEYFSSEEINKLLAQASVSFRVSFKAGHLSVEVLPIEVVIAVADPTGHPNIRVLIERMDDALVRNDCAGVLHASACVYETMAKDIVGVSTVQDKTLKAFFDRYRKDSGLPEAILDYILSIYEDRNTTPLAGHGSTQAPEITYEQATILSEITKAFVRIEYKLRVSLPER